MKSTNVISIILMALIPITGYLYEVYTRQLYPLPLIISITIFETFIGVMLILYNNPEQSKEIKQ